ncbi:YkgJ family cysteine cluster protein [Myroides odoratimimus]|nr:YkgJ family cysteine cluster protein [Myroides odoratimimus]
MFDCSKCGLCCQNLKGVTLYADLDKGDGTCKYFKENLCSIYEDRPIFCRVDQCYDLYFKQVYTKQEYYELNKEVCDSLKISNCIIVNKVITNK